VVPLAWTVISVVLLDLRCNICGMITFHCDIYSMISFEQWIYIYNRKTWTSLTHKNHKNVCIPSWSNISLLFPESNTALSVFNTQFMLTCQVSLLRIKQENGNRSYKRATVELCDYIQWPGDTTDHREWTKWIHLALDMLKGISWIL
jgi:hypothetical protein